MQLRFTPEICCLYCSAVFRLPEGAPLTVVCKSCSRERAAPQQEPSPLDPAARERTVLGDLVTVNQLVEETPFTVAQIRGLLFDRKTNGLEVAVVKVGNRLYLHRSRFARWLDGRFEAREEASQA